MTLVAKNITIIFLCFLAVKEVLEFYLEWRNKGHILKNRERVPDQFADKISLDEHQKAADYSITKIKLGAAFNIFGILILLLVFKPTGILGKTEIERM